MSSRPCEHFDDGAGYCGSPDGVRLFVNGPRCPIHTPAKLSGREDVVADPTRTAEALYRKAFGHDKPDRINRQDTAVTDQKAIATGKRRSSPGAYRNARANIDERKNG